MTSYDVRRPAEATRSNGALSGEVADQLLDAITGARWFGGKGRRADLTSVTRLPWLTPVAAWPAVRFEIAEISYPVDHDADPPLDPRDAASTSELYALPVAYWPAPPPGQQHAELGRWSDPELGAVVALDAAQDPVASQILLQTLVDARTVRGEGNEAAVAFHLSVPGVLAPDLEPRLFSGQQSNTSVMYGNVAMLKLFRRLELGHNLDIEVHDALSRSGLTDVAQLYGWIDATWWQHGARVRADLGMAVEMLAGAEDGWALALASLREARSFAPAAGALGTALAETHAGLRAAFPTSQVSGEELARTMRARLAGAGRQARVLDPYVEGLDRLFAALAGRHLETQRTHGDFHLGQTLHTPDGWKIIDFEGEPVKTLAERAAPDSVGRDLAGMLRSFDYAAASVAGPGSRAWVAECRDAFLTAYAGGAAGHGDPVVLAAYEADKAVYEVVYEMRNRPDWVDIPLAAVATLAGTARDATTTDGTAKE